MSINFNSLPFEIKSNIFQLVKDLPLPLREVSKEFNELMIENFKKFFSKMIASDDTQKYFDNWSQMAVRSSWPSDWPSDKILRTLLFFRKVEVQLAKAFELNHELAIVPLSQELSSFLLTKDSEKALMKVLDEKQEEVVEFLFLLTGLTNASIQDLEKHFKQACEGGCESFPALLLLSSRCKEISPTVLGESLEEAVRKGHTKIVSLLLDSTKAEEIPVKYFKRAIQLSKNNWNQFPNLKQIFIKLTTFLNSDIGNALKELATNHLPCSIM